MYSAQRVSARVRADLQPFLSRCRDVKEPKGTVPYMVHQFSHISIGKPMFVFLNVDSA